MTDRDHGAKFTFPGCSEEGLAGRGAELRFLLRGCWAVVEVKLAACGKISSKQEDIRLKQTSYFLTEHFYNLTREKSTSDEL